MTKEFNRCFLNARQGKLHWAYQQRVGKFPRPMVTFLLWHRYGYSPASLWQGKLPVNKQPNLCLITHERERALALGLCVCGQTVRVHTSPHCICFLISNQHMRGFPASSRPFEILPACLFMSSTRVFLGLHLFFSFLNSPPCSPQRNSTTSPPPPPDTHTLVKMHTSAALWRGLWEVIRMILCITMNLVWHHKNSKEIIQ